MLWIGAVVMALVMPAEPVFLDYRAEKAYLADRARSMAPIAYLTLGVSVLLGAAAIYRRRFADGRDLFWPAVLFTALGVVWATGAWPHIVLSK